MADDTKPNPENTPNPGGQQGEPGSGAGNGNPSTNGDAKAFTQEQQEQINKLIAKTKREVEEKHKRESEEAKRKQDEEDAKKRGEFEALAKQYEGERDTAKAEAEGYKAKYDALADKVRAATLEEIKTLPEHIQALAPPTSDLDSLLEWLPKGKQAAGKEQPKAPGNGRDPKPAGDKSDAEARKGQSRLYKTL